MQMGFVSFVKMFQNKCNCDYTFSAVIILLDYIVVLLILDHNRACGK